MMKCVTIILIIVVPLARCLHLSDHIVQVWLNATKDYNNECIPDAHDDPINIRNMFHILDIQYLRSTECYFRCIYEKLNYLFPNGTFNQQLIVSDLDYYSLELGKKCEEEAAVYNDLCKKSHTMAHCVMYNLDSDHQKRKSTSGK
ncbi:hypothetical protein FQA39_LY12358 [Lamprigera yunnana]|nr:hypothetical protein FQA39_LY12358 [Lamprigera yunnana]